MRHALDGGVDPAALAARDWDTGAPGEPLRFAVVGLGWFGRDVALRAIAESDYCEATVAVSGSAEKARRVADQHSLAAGVTYDAFHEGAATGEYDAVYVATPNARHLPFAETAAAHGKHVLCEKPVEVTAERAAAMVEACEAAGVRLMVAYRMQAEPLTRHVRAAVADGAFGEVVQFDGAFTAGHLRGDHDQWRFDPGLAGGGALYDVGVYPLNAARFLLDADPVGVSASVVRNEAALGGMDEHCAFRLAFPGGATADCRTSYRAAGSAFYEVVGTEGRVRVESAFDVAPERRLVVELRGDGARTEVTADFGDEVVEEFDYFAHAVRAGAPIEPDGADGLADVRVMEAVYEADERGETVDPGIDADRDR